MKAIHKLLLPLLLFAAVTPGRAADYQLFARTNLVAWCIVPFDAKQRGPEARAQMLERIGITKLAYDWRAKDIPTFDAEVAALKKHGVEMTAWWFPGALNADAWAILNCIKRNQIHPQLWACLEGGPHLRLTQAFERTPALQEAHIARMVAAAKPIAAEAAKLGCQVALYNHGGWFGVPENQIEIIKRLKQDGVENVGMVYTQHHGYGEIDRFAELFPKMQPYLLAVSLHGLTKNGDLQNNSLREAPLGQGEEDLRLLRIIKESGWAGQVGMLGEMASADAELRLLDQLAGLDWLVPQLDGQAPGPLPVTQAWKTPAPPRTATGEASVSGAFGKALRGGMIVAGKAEYRQRPLTVECRAKLDSATAFNILVASDTKASAEHWELYSFAGSGSLSLYQPGRGGNVSAEVNICDGQWHYLAAVIEPERVRLFVDGKLVKDAPAMPLTGTPIPGELAIGQLVEGDFVCDGVVDDVRLSRGAREINNVPTGPLTKDATTIDLWNFDATTTTTANSSAATPVIATPAAAAPSAASLSAAFGQALRGEIQAPGKAEYRQRPLTVECWAKLDSASAYNILVASDTKASAEHWELYSVAGSGTLSVYQPGGGGVFDSEVNICDSKWHYLAAVIEPERVRLFVDGKLVKDAPATPVAGEAQPGDLKFGNLVEGGMGCDGVIDNVRISRGAREINRLPSAPLTKDATTISLWNFDDGTAAGGNAPAVAPAAAATAAPGGTPASTAFGKALRGGMNVEGKAEYRQRPLTVECRAKLDSATAFNILVASDTKASAEHWELYSYAGSGALSLYQPGRGGDFNSGVNICDGQWHCLAAIIEPARVRLFVDGKLVKDAPATPLAGEPQPGELAFGQLVEGGIGCDGEVDNVRLSRGAREISGVPVGPLTKDATTIGLWDFEDAGAAVTGKTGKYWAIEDAAERAKLPEFRTIPAALPSDLTPANGFPKRDTFRNWQRSHGDNSGARYSALDRINRQNVTNLQMAWTYHSKDGAANIQCNPVIADGVMFAPTAGNNVVAVNATTGSELWRFKPAGHPAHRGLIYWPGQAAETPRVFFASANFLYALDPKTGQPVSGFGQNGRMALPGAAVVAPTIFEHIIVVPGFDRDVWGLDLITGKLLWTFHTQPRAGEFGFDTWDRMAAGANCWGGMALDEVRGIAYVTTGSPKDNFIGVSHRGDNLYGNCIIAIDARTGQRLWHFQEIHHDIWDLDMPAPPNLTTITRDGKRVDVVAAVTKIGNTILLDRVTGKPIFPYRERRAPASTLPGEQTSPYQPDVELPQPFAKMEFTAADITDRSEEATSFIEGRFKSSTTGFFQPAIEGKMNLFFSIHGGANWPGACVDAESGRLFVTANHIPWTISVFRDEDPPYNPKALPTPGQKFYEATCANQCHGVDRVGVGMAPPLRGLRFRMDDQALADQIRTGKNGMPAMPNITDSDMKALADFLFLRDQPTPPTPPKSELPRYSYNGYPKFLDSEGYPGSKPPWGTLNCLDLNSGKILWRVPLGEYPELTKEGIPKTGTENFGGAIVTAGGLVFCAGTRDSKIRAFDKDTGAELWSAKLPWVGSAPPACYEVNGRQFIVVAATGGGKLATPVGDAYVAFALPAVNP